jgi:hypothetical protein
VTFVQQAVQSQSGMAAVDIHRTLRPSHSRQSSESATTLVSYPAQLSIFVIFEKKAGIIRIADSAVGELELFSGHEKDAAGFSPSSSSKDSLSRFGSNLNSSSSGNFGNRRRSHSVGNLQKNKGTWLHPIQVDVPPPPSATDYTLPTPGSPGSTPVYLLTRGKTTHVLPYPLPALVNARPPLRVLTWSAPPNHVAVRINHTPYEHGAMPFVQFIAFTDDGVEVHELDRDLILGRESGKGKGRALEPVYALADIGGETGFLCAGGHWQRAPDARLARAFSVASDASGTSFESLDSVQTGAKLSMEQGIYGWVCKGLEDYRVFWVGGTGKEGLDEDWDG